MSKAWGLMCCALTMLAVADPTWAEPKASVEFHGRLEETYVGEAVALHASLYDSLIGGEKLWGPERHVLENIEDDGTFVLQLGAGDRGRFCATAGENATAACSLDAIARLHGELYLGLRLETKSGELIDLEPRQRLMPAFHAYSASVVRALAPGTVDAGMVADGAVGSEQIADQTIKSNIFVPGEITDSHIVPEGLSRIAEEAISDRHIAPQGITKVRKGAGILLGPITTADLSVVANFECRLAAESHPRTLKVNTIRQCDIDGLCTDVEVTTSDTFTDDIRCNPTLHEFIAGGGCEWSEAIPGQCSLTVQKSLPLPVTWPPVDSKDGWGCEMSILCPINKNTGFKITSAQAMTHAVCCKAELK